MRKRLLIADDSSTVRDVLRIFLEQRTSLEICGEAADGQEAVEKAMALRPDLVLLDYSMPKMNGAEAASVLKRLIPEIHIILFTMYSEDIGRSVMSAIGVDAVLSKPDGLAALGEAIENVFSRPAPAILKSPDASSRGAEPVISDTAPALAAAAARTSIAPAERSSEPLAGDISFVRLVRRKTTGEGC